MYKRNNIIYTFIISKVKLFCAALYPHNELLASIRNFLVTVIGGILVANILGMCQKTTSNKELQIPFTPVYLAPVPAISTPSLSIPSAQTLKSSEQNLLGSVNLDQAPAISTPSSSNSSKPALTTQTPSVPETPASLPFNKIMPPDKNHSQIKHDGNRPIKDLFGRID